MLAKSIRESINNNEPETALDRLHTFTTGYIRRLCDKHNIDYGRDTPLNGIFGGYVKFLMENKIIESEMTERILRSSISIMEYFNKVRNFQSYAHDNPILNHDESILIFNNITSLIRFIDTIEIEDVVNKEEKYFFPPGWDEIPF